MIKKTLSILFVAVAIFFSTTASAQKMSANDRKLIAKARVAASDCIRPYLKKGYKVEGSVEIVSSCFYKGFISKVTFYTIIPCHKQPCPKAPSLLVATVYFNCDDNVSQVECTN